MGRGYAAAKARRQAASAAAAGQGAVAEPTVAAQPVAPAVNAAPEVPIGSSNQRENVKITNQSLTNYRNDIRELKTLERLNDNNADSFTLTYGANAGADFRQLSGGAYLARLASEKLAPTIKRNGKSEGGANGSVEFARGAALLRRSRENMSRLSRTRDLNYTERTTALNEIRTDIGMAITLFRVASRRFSNDSVFSDLNKIRGFEPAR